MWHEHAIGREAFNRAETMGAAGIELPSDSTGNTQHSDESGTDSGTVSVAPIVSLQPDLAEVVKTWLTLAPAIRAGILAMVQAAKLER
jgi:hypothetical protein